MANFKTYSPNQPFVLPLHIKDFIPDDHVVHVVHAVVEQLDLSSIYLHITNEHGGCPAYHPKMMLKVLFYAYAEGISSSRQIAKRVESDVNYMYLAGMQVPDFRTISKFRKDNHTQLGALFVQIVKLCMAMGLVSLGHIAIDGSKLRACAGRKSTKSKETLEGMEQEIQKRIQEAMAEAERIDAEDDERYGSTKRGDEIPKELAKQAVLLQKIREAKKLLEERELQQINLTDPDSRFMKSADGAKNVSYNTQIAVDADHQIIVAQDVVSDPTDQHQLVPMYEQVVDNTGKKPEEVSADSGYDSNSNYVYIEENGINALVPDQMTKKEIDDDGEEHIAQFDKRNFTFDQERNMFICPEKQPLLPKKEFSKGGVRYSEYEGITCDHCRSKSKCTKARFRKVTISKADAAKAKMRQKLNTLYGKIRYGIRLYTVEPVYAHIKRVQRFCHFQLRGRSKVKGEFSLMCIGYNLTKIYISLSIEKIAKLLDTASLRYELIAC